MNADKGRRKIVSFLGPNGTFTEEAAHHFFHNGFEFKPYKTIPDVLDAVEKHEVDFAIAPLENSIEGSVNLTLDWLIHECTLPIKAEVVLPISQHLMTADKDCQLADIKKLYSHPQPVAQCRNFLRSRLPDVEIEYVNSTAEAAKIIASDPKQPWAAIGNRLAKEFYDLTYVEKNIEDFANNYTRFVVVGEKLDMDQEHDRYRTTIVVTLPEDYPGALHQVLYAFAWRKINLSRIESRPTKKGLGSYYFLIDIEKKLDDVLMPGAFAEIEALGCQVKHLGTYPYYTIDVGDTIKSS